jgi:hypothetical protein
MTNLHEMFLTGKNTRSGFKTSDQVQGPRGNGITYLILKKLMYASSAGRSRKRSIHGSVSIYRRPATQPLGLRWGFEITSNSTANEQHRLLNVKPKRLAVLAKPRRYKPGAVSVFYMAWD